jgi:hypothetical protein
MTWDKFGCQTSNWPANYKLAKLAKLAKEADQYAASFLERREKCDYTIGVPDVRNIRALFTSEAARLMCAGVEVVCRNCTQD